MSFEPKIIAFCCNWCSYAAADLAGSSRMHYPDNVRIIRVMCSGMVHPELIVEAFNNGADGVMVLGCHLGECHYRNGNYMAKERFDMVEDLLEDYGFEAERFSLGWVASVEPDKFVRAVTDMTLRIREMGPISGQPG